MHTPKSPLALRIAVVVVALTITTGLVVHASQSSTPVATAPPPHPIPHINPPPVDAAPVAIAPRAPDNIPDASDPSFGLGSSIAPYGDRFGASKSAGVFRFRDDRALRPQAAALGQRNGQ